ncbi:MAG TPA: 2-hydroxymuconate tautomerase [Candidatus Polarisedimenticolaceae bacterium]|nr:2-hydroxymuconate tautomerase [Candidatus Polarisedimenticolaceae bacterium]
MPLVEIHLLRGRTPEQKKNLLGAVTQAVHETLDAPLTSIRVWIHEMGDEDYMAAGQLASDRRKKR